MYPAGGRGTDRLAIELDPDGRAAFAPERFAMGDVELLARTPVPAVGRLAVAPAPFARAKLLLLAGGRGTLCALFAVDEPVVEPGCAVRPARFSGLLLREVLPVRPDSLFAADEFMRPLLAAVCRPSLPVVAPPGRAVVGEFSLAIVSRLAASTFAGRMPPLRALFAILRLALEAGGPPCASAVRPPSTDSRVGLMLARFKA